ncbi:hypothetical protein [Flavobacterium piscis]|uniref:HEAT repeat domain-containing protein n=1 Tax=Flavobacterium piscis TaxID=1114874 RepID=A0ABU1YCW1_9FLAO|nr:hypothetical protein [Flavobacterium piscis]MDR7212078.1 hypothetical protein [Flavobacterium piscis]
MSINSKSFDEVLKIAENELTLPYFYSTPENIYALSGFGNDPLLRPKIISFLENSFDILRKVACDKKTEKDKIWNYDTLVMVNHVIFGAIGRTVGMLNATELAPLLYKEFVDMEDSVYRINYEEKGTLAIALSILGYQGEIKEIQDTLDDAVSNEHYILEREDILEMFYAFCILKNDKTRALDYLSNHKRTKNLSLVAAALADLDAKEGLPVLKERLLQLSSPFTKEAFLEAIHRLETQKEAPAPKDRMIWMFGKRSTTEIELGHEPDNAFVLRAIKKNGSEEFEEYYESFY